MEIITATDLFAIATNVRKEEERARKETLKNWLDNEILPACKKRAEFGEFQAEFAREDIPSNCKYIHELQQLVATRGFGFSYNKDTFSITW